MAKQNFLKNLAQPSERYACEEGGLRCADTMLVGDTMDLRWKETPRNLEGEHSTRTHDGMTKLPRN
jgi:hypothetical protein